MADFLPAYPWDQRPSDQPLSADEVCAALFTEAGDIDRSAERLKVGSLVLRKFIERSARARAVINETDRLMADTARRKLRAALHDDTDARRQDWAIRYILNSSMARSYGLSSTDDARQSPANLNLNLTVQPVQWADGTPIVKPADPPPLLELAPIKPAADGG